MSQEKTAKTAVPIHPLIAGRWSPRAFDTDREVGHDSIVSVLEAARWAPSCFGDEPWQFIVCNRRDEPQAWRAALGCLAEKNQRWARNAPVLVLAAAARNFRHNDRPNRWSQHDTGAACENLCLQAVALGLAAHQMGGFDVDRTQRLFGVPESHECIAFIALGYYAGPEKLDGEFRAAELAERRRRPLKEICYSGKWAEPFS